jgi:signal transduction histidine kinase
MTPMVAQAADTAAARNDGLRSTLTWSLLVLAGLLPIVLLSLYAYRVTSESVRELVVANNRSAAQMAAELVGREFENSISLGNAAAMIPAMVEAVERHDVEAVRMRLKATVQAFPRLDRAFVVDTQGILWADYPVALESLNRSFAHRDYFRGLSQAWKPYVSEVFQRQAEPRLMMVAVAVPIRSKDRKVLGGIVYQHRLEELTRWVRQVGVGGEGYVFVVDQRGAVAAHPKLDPQTRQYVEYAALAPVEAALHGRESTLEYFDPLARQTMVATFVPVPLAEQYWVVVAQQPVDRAYASIRRLGANLGAVTGILAVATLAVVLVLGRIRQQLRLANHELVADIAERKQTEATLKRKERLLKQLLDIYEGQRKIVVFEIHDGIAQPLAGALMNCEAALRLLEDGNPDAAREGFHKTVELLQENLAETRRLMRDLRPTILDDFGVIAAVDQLIARTREEECGTIDWSHDVQFQRLAPPLEIALFRIVQEGLANALHHSGSDRVRIALVQHGDRLRLEVEDWGAGFDPANVGESRFGLAGIRERAGLFAGEASIDSTPGKGTRIAVEFPVVEASAVEASTNQNEQE